MAVVIDIGRALREGALMFWDTLWALVLGFGLSGAVQAFVPRQAMRSRLGDHRPASVVRASLFGMASSSCSYAASAMARSLVGGGADFLAAMVFMFASTNLVVELGIVLAVLIGWQFVAAEFVGGTIMIALLVLLGGLWLRGRSLDRARSRATADPVPGHGQAAAHGGAAGTGSWHRRARTKAGWEDAAAYTMGDLRMLRREMVIGFGAAGFLAVLVPSRAWGDLFLHGHGTLTSLENAAVGPFVALISFVCSIGNVPLAAALWHGGISFGGVVAFLFADLLAFPLLLIYRRQYGGRMALRLLALFWLVMSAAGLATEYLFRAAGWVPAPRRGGAVPDGFGLGWTTWLDVLALLAFAVLFALARRRHRSAAEERYAKDPVCGMLVEVGNAPASTTGEDGETVWFCSEHCRDRFERTPAGRLAD